MKHDEVRLNPALTANESSPNTNPEPSERPVAKNQSARRNNSAASTGIRVRQWTTSELRENLGRSVIKGARTRLAVRRALERLGSKATPALEGVAGPLAFEKNHDIAGRAVVISSISRSRGDR